MYKWQVYGPQRNGLALCHLHRGVKSLNDAAIVSQIVFGTAIRGLRWRREVTLPSLQSFRHILRKVRSQTFEMSYISDLLDRVPISQVGDARVRSSGLDVLTRHKVRRSADLARDNDDKREGEIYFAKLKAYLISVGKMEFVTSLRYCDYRPKKKILFVDLPEELRGRFAGSGRVHLRTYSAVIGVDVLLERTQRSVLG